MTLDLNDAAATAYEIVWPYLVAAYDLFLQMIEELKLFVLTNGSHCANQIYLAYEATSQCSGICVRNTAQAWTVLLATIFLALPTIYHLVMCLLRRLIDECRELLRWFIDLIIRPAPLPIIVPHAVAGHHPVAPPPPGPPAPGPPGVIIPQPFGGPAHVTWLLQNDPAQFLNANDLLTVTYQTYNYAQCLAHNRIPTYAEATHGFWPGTNTNGCDFPADQNRITMLMTNFANNVATLPAPTRPSMIYNELKITVEPLINSGRFGGHSNYATVTGHFNTLHVFIDNAINTYDLGNYAWHAQQLHIKVKLGRENHVVVNNPRYTRNMRSGP